MPTRFTAVITKSEDLPLFVARCPQVGTVSQGKTEDFVRQKGSHIVLKRPHPTGTGDVIVLPNHKKIDKWTLGDSLKLANVGIEEFLDSL